MTIGRKKAADITDPREMLDRIIARNNRLRERIALHDDPVQFAQHLASRTNSDLRRLAKLLDERVDDKPR